MARINGSAPAQRVSISDMETVGQAGCEGLRLATRTAHSFVPETKGFELLDLRFAEQR
jgi:hypothetical protein